MCGLLHSLTVTEVNFTSVTPAVPRAEETLQQIVCLCFSLSLYGLRRSKSLVLMSFEHVTVVSGPSVQTAH